MVVSINRENLSAIADSIMTYIFISVKKDDNVLDIDIMCDACDAYRSLKKEAQTTEANTVNVEFTAELTDFLKYSIAEYVFDEIRDCEEERIDAKWLCCITDLYRQLNGYEEAEDVYPDNESDHDPLEDEDFDSYPDEEDEIATYEEKKNEDEDQTVNDEEKEMIDISTDIDGPIEVPWLM